MAGWVDILGRVALAIVSILSYPLRLVWGLVAGIFNIFYILATPGIIVVSSIFSWIASIANFFLSLEVGPITHQAPHRVHSLTLPRPCPADLHIRQSRLALHETFTNASQVACGAFIGILAGVCVAGTSGFLTAVLGMEEQPKVEPSDEYYYESTIATPGSSSPTRRSSRADDSSSYDEWMFLENVPRSRRKRNDGLLSQTILEETDPEI